MKKTILLCIVLALLSISNSAFAGRIKVFAQTYDGRRPDDGSWNQHYGEDQIKHKVFVTYDECFKSHWMKKWFSVYNSSYSCYMNYCNKADDYTWYSCNGKDKAFAVIKKIRVNTYRKKYSKRDDTWEKKWHKIKQKTFNIKKKKRKADQKWTINVECIPVDFNVKCSLGASAKVTSCNGRPDRKTFISKGYTIRNGYAFKYEIINGLLMCQDRYKDGYIKY